MPGEYLSAEVTKTVAFGEYGSLSLKVLGEHLSAEFSKTVAFGEYCSPSAESTRNVGVC